MKPLIKVLFLLLVLVSARQASYSQITKQDAIDLVLDTLFVNDLDSLSIFMDSTILSEDYYKMTVCDSIESPYDEYWLFFIDKEPWTFHWGHACSYVFINKLNGLYTEIEEQVPPFQYYEMLEHVSVTFKLTGFSHDFTSGPLSHSYPSDNDNLYAVIFAVSGLGKEAEVPIIWNNVAHTFAALKNNGFPDENIYILFNDGIAEGPNSDFPSLDLNNDFQADILYNVICNKSSIDNILSDLSEEMDEDDILFMYSWTHGFKDELVNKRTKLGLFEDEIYDYQLASMVDQVNCSEFIYINEACHGGGIIDDFSGIHQTIITAVEWESSIYNGSEGQEELGYTPYTYALMTALRGEHPKSYEFPWESEYSIGNHPTLLDFILFSHLSGDFNPDTETYGNQDGIIQINEAIQYGKILEPLTFGTRGVHIYNSGFDETDDLLCLTGLSGTINTTQTVDGNFLVGGDLTLAQGTTLTVDNSSKFFFANGDFTTASGSQLSLGSNVSFKNYQTLSTFDFNGGVTFNTGGSFKSIENTTLKLRMDNQLLQASFVNNTFENCDIHSYASSLTANGSTFTNCEMIYSYRGAIDISNNCQFINSGLYLENADQDNDNVSITNSSFTTNQNLLGISLWSYDYFTVSNNTFSDYYDGIQVMQTGQGIPTARTISGNTISGSTNAGIVTFNSGVNIAENTIQNNNDGIRVLNNSTVSIQGNPSAQNYSEMNLIQNNDRYEVYSSTGSFPWYFRYNAIFDTDNNGIPEDPHIYYQPSGTMQTLDVRYNCWDVSFSPNQDLYPVGSYLYGPTWCPPGANKSSDIVLQAYLDGLEHFENEEFADARETFEEVIEQYPQTQYASSAMKELLALEKVNGNNYIQLQQYYNTEDSIQAYPDLVKLAGYISNQCELAMENWQTAIDYFEDIIEDPDSPEDSIFAIIDLGYTYILMENSGQKSTAQGRLLQYKPESKIEFSAKRDTMLALLPFKTKPQEIQTEFDQQTPGKLLQNIPNPFTGITTIYYHLEQQALVSIKVYDHLGKTVKQLNFSSQQAGQNEVELNLNDLPSGIYFYSLYVNGQLSDTKKMVIK